MDIILASSTITCVARNSLTEFLLDDGGEWLTAWQREAGESDINGLETASERRGIVGVRSRDFLERDSRGPVFVCFHGLGNSVGRDFCVGPDGGSVAV